VGETKFVTIFWDNPRMYQRVRLAKQNTHVDLKKPDGDYSFKLHYLFINIFLLYINDTDMRYERFLH